MKKIFFLIAIGTYLLATPTYACTGISIVSKDKKNIQARTIEWGEGVLLSNVIVSPRNKKYQSPTSKGGKGHSWTGKYGFVGISLVDNSFIGEGVNEVGLSAGIFFFPDQGSLTPYNAKNVKKSIIDMELVRWALSNFSTVEEVKEGLKKIIVTPVAYKSDGTPEPTGHWRIADSKGGNIVIEIVENGKVNIFDNKVGVLTNSPDYEWQIKNLNNYVNLRPGAAKGFDVNGVTLSQFGAGSGFLGLPGDITPPSRFVRAFFHLQNDYIPKTGYNAVVQGFHLLNNFDIPIGIEFPDKKYIPENLPSATQWTSVINSNDLEFYYNTMYNNNIRKIDLKKIDFSTVKDQIIPLDEGTLQPFVEINIK